MSAQTESEHPDRAHRRVATDADAEAWRPSAPFTALPADAGTTCASRQSLSEGGVSLSFDVEPLPVQSVRARMVGGFARMYQPARNVRWKRRIAALAARQLPRGFRPFDCPVEVRAEFAFAPPKSMRKRERREIEDGGRVLKDTKPDLPDNLMKGLIDALTGALWTDDSRIARVRSEKFYARKPGITLTVAPLPRIQPPTTRPEQGLLFHGI